MHARNGAFVVPGTNQQHVADDDPTRWRAPARLQHVRAWEIAACRWHGYVRGSEAKSASSPVQHGAKDTRRVQTWQAHPLHVATVGNQGRDLAVRQKPVLRDRWER